LISEREEKEGNTEFGLEFGKNMIRARVARLGVLQLSTASISDQVGRINWLDSNGRVEKRFSGEKMARGENFLQRAKRGALSVCLLTCRLPHLSWSLGAWGRLLPHINIKVLSSHFYLRKCSIIQISSHLCRDLSLLEHIDTTNEGTVV
jgi:hypothetical protein